jgi:hypothetical protein
VLPGDVAELPFALEPVVPSLFVPEPFAGAEPVFPVGDVSEPAAVSLVELLGAFAGLSLPQPIAASPRALRITVS